MDLTEDLEVTEDGALTLRTDIRPLGELTITTHGWGVLVTGSARVVAEGPVGGMLRFDLPDLGQAAVATSPPLRAGLLPLRRQEELHQHRGCHS